jgi:hypothetical protein
VASSSLMEFDRPWWKAVTSASVFHPLSAAKMWNSVAKSAPGVAPWRRLNSWLAVSCPPTGWLKTHRSSAVKDNMELQDGGCCSYTSMAHARVLPESRETIKEIMAQTVWDKGGLWLKHQIALSEEPLASYMARWPLYRSGAVILGSWCRFPGGTIATPVALGDETWALASPGLGHFWRESVSARRVSDIWESCSCCRPVVLLDGL